MRQATLQVVVMMIVLMFVPMSIAQGDSADPKPNVLFILIDDLGWKDVGFMGSQYYETPHTDSISENGMVFMNAYTANPLCSPTRASIMSGTWPARNGLTSAAGHVKDARLTSVRKQKDRPDKRALEAVSATRLHPDSYTLAEAFRDAGYRTAHVGKWHMGTAPSDPLSQGFDVDIPHTNAPSPLPEGWFAPWPVWRGQGKKGDHLEDRMAEEAVAFIKQHRKDHKDVPFLLNYWAFSVHSPWNAKQAVIDKYVRKTDHYAARHNPVYAAMIDIMDQAVGRLLQALEESGLSENTIVIFYSDNGGWYKDASKFVHPDYVRIPMGSNTPLREGKASIYEGGTRVPLAISWPGHIKPGSVNHQAIVSSVDIYPTLLDLCNIKPKQPVPLDGISIKAALQGKVLERDEIYCHFPHYIKATGNAPATYVRKGNWKLIKFYHDRDDQTHRFELYNLHWDISEIANVASAHPQRVQQLNALIETHLHETGGIVPLANPDYQRTGNGPQRPRGSRL